MGIIEQLAEIKAEEVRAEVKIEGKQETVRVLLANTEFSMSKIANLVGVSAYFVKKVKESLRQKLQTK